MELFHRIIVVLFFAVLLLPINLFGNQNGSNQIIPEASAAPFIIDFESVLTHQPLTTLNGITFNSQSVYDYSQNPILPGFAHSGNKAIEHCFGIEFCGLQQTIITFTAQQTHVGLYIGYDGIHANNFTVNLVAFDLNGNQIAQASTVLLPSTVPQPIRIFLQVNSPGIHGIRVGPAPQTQDDDHLAIDDVEYDTAGQLSAQISNLHLPADQSINQIAIPPKNSLIPQGTSNSDSPEWQQYFQQWNDTHCKNYRGPQTKKNIAFIPVKFSDDKTVHLTIDQIIERAEYIKDYYYQQSMCSVLISYTVYQGPDAGWFTLPHTHAEDFLIQNDDSFHTIGAINTWMDADKVWTQSQPPKHDRFNAIVVITTANDLRSRAIISDPIATSGNVKAFVFFLDGLMNLLPGGQLLGPNPISHILLGAQASEHIVQQGSIITTDNDIAETWAHELGHGIFGFWDYYDHHEVFVRGVLLPWDIMSNPGSNPPPPVSSVNRELVGWANYVSSHDNPATIHLSPLEDMTFGGNVYTWQDHDCCFSHSPLYILEQRTSTDGVSSAPEQPYGNYTSYRQLSGVEIYEIMDAHSTSTGSLAKCGALDPIAASALDILLDHGFNRCVFAMSNLMAHPNKDDAENNLTLYPGQTFKDNLFGVQFTLNNADTITVHKDPPNTTVVGITSQLLGNGTVAPAYFDIQTGLHMPWADLHVYSADGKHVGPNYTNGKYDVNIPGSETEGNLLPLQWISIPDNMTASYIIDGSRVISDAKAHGISNPIINGTLLFVHYDASDNRTTTTPVNFLLDSNNTSTAQTNIPNSQIIPEFPLGPVLVMMLVFSAMIFVSYRYAILQ